MQVTAGRPSFGVQCYVLTTNKLWTVYVCNKHIMFYNHMHIMTCRASRLDVGIIISRAFVIGKICITLNVFFVIFFFFFFFANENK
jgi:hypothetical protein